MSMFGVFACCKGTSLHCAGFVYAWRLHLKDRPAFVTTRRVLCSKSYYPPKKNVPQRRIFEHFQLLPQHPFWPQFLFPFFSSMVAVVVVLVSCRCRRGFGGDGCVLSFVTITGIIIMPSMQRVRQRNQMRVS